MFRELIELGVVEIDTEPLDDRIERRPKEFWKNTSCPRCGHQSIVIWENIDRIWCRDYNFKPVYTYGTPFLGRAYRAVYTAIREVEATV
jgi:hypothetical protein